MKCFAWAIIIIRNPETRGGCKYQSNTFFQMSELYNLILQKYLQKIIIVFKNKKNACLTQARLGL